MLYREIVFYTKKLILIFLVSYLDIEMIQKSYIVLIVLAIFLIIQRGNNPFVTKKLNFLSFNESFTVVTILISALITCISVNDKETETICTIAIYILNFQFFFFCLKDIILYNLETILNLKIFRKLFPWLVFISPSNYF